MEARIVLLVVGVVIIVSVIYDFLRRRDLQKRNGILHEHADLLMHSEEFFDPIVDEPYIKAAPAQRIEPIFVDDSGLDINQALEDYVETEPQPVARSIPQKIVTLSIMCRDPHGFDGNELYHALHRADLHFGKGDIFYKYAQEDGAGDVLFFVVKAVEPGYFYIDRMRSEQIPGISLVMIADDLFDPQLAFEKLIGTAKQLAFVLNGELLDHKRDALTLTTIANYKAKIQAA